VRDRNLQQRRDLVQQLCQFVQFAIHLGHSQHRQQLWKHQLQRLTCQLISRAIGSFHLRKDEWRGEQGDVPLFMPLPPEMTIGAEVNSGLSDLLTFSETKLERFALQSSSERVRASVVAEPPSVGALSNPVALVKISFTGSSICTVAMALPA
jgi:hypothetical protein